MSKINIQLSNLLTYLVYFFPITFVFGNLFINIFVLLTIALGLFLFGKELFSWKDKIPLFLILIFFIILLISSFYQNFFFKEYSDWTKSILYLRFFLFLMVIKTMTQKQILKIDNFIYICFFITIIFTIDILIQFFLGFNLLGFKPINFTHMTYYSGFFNKELVAGGFILMFSLFGIFALPILFKNTKKVLVSLFFLTLFFLVSIALILAGNRMPVIMFALFAGFLTLIIKNKEYKKKFLILSLCILIVGISIIYNTPMIKERFRSFFNAMPNPIVILSEVRQEYPQLDKYKGSGELFSNTKEFKDSKITYNKISFWTGHIQIFITSLDLIIENPVLGNGIKSYRNNCFLKVHLPNRVCESHPHNFYLDILNDTGILGLIFIIIPVLILLFNVYKEYYKGDLRDNNISNWIYLAVILSVIIQFFPFKSSGSFFSTFNSGYTFLILGFLIGLNEIRHKNVK